jgi:uncharacterized glyoxalase superfamily protein PhnB
MAKFVPDGYHTLTPYLIVPDGEKELRFLTEVFGAKVCERHNRADGTLKHGELQIGDSRLMMAQATKEYNQQTMTFYVYVQDVDATYERALGAGARSLAPVSQQYYGDRNGGFVDPAGISWYVATHVEDLSSDEIQRRSEELDAQAAKK